MRVCLISPYPPRTDGTAEYCKSLAESLVPLAQVAVIAEEDPPAPRKEFVNGVDVRRISQTRAITWPLRIFKEVAVTRPDVVHLQYESYGLYGKFDFITIPVLLLTIRILGIPACVTIHTYTGLPRNRKNDFDYRASSSLRKARKYLYQVVRMTIIMAFRTLRPKLIVHSDLLAKKLIGDAGAYPDSIEVVPIGAAPVGRRIKKAEATEALGLGAGKVILFFGFISVFKRIEDLVTAFRKVAEKVPNCTLIISGAPATFDPAAQEYCADLRQQASWTRKVVFVDRFVSRREMHLLFSAADVLVIPYFERHASSGVLPTAVAYGLPLVAAKGGTSGADIEHNGIGLVYSSGNAADLATCISRVLQDEELAAEFSKNATKLLVSRSQDAVAKKTLRIYSELVSEFRFKASGS